MTRVRFGLDCKTFSSASGGHHRDSRHLEGKTDEAKDANYMLRIIRSMIEWKRNLDPAYASRSRFT